MECDTVFRWPESVVGVPLRVQALVAAARQHALRQHAHCEGPGQVQLPHRQREGVLPRGGERLRRRRRGVDGAHATPSRRTWGGFGGGGSSDGEDDAAFFIYTKLDH